MQTNQRLLNALKAILARPNIDKSLCADIEARLLENSSAERQLFMMLYRQWPGYSGWDSYPIRSDISDPTVTPRDQYARNFRGKNFYHDNQGTQRRELLRFCIMKLEREINANEKPNG
jgi:hypothetical protein